MEHNKPLFSKRIFIVSLCFVALVGIFMFVFLSARINAEKQNSLIYNMKDLSYFEYFYFGSSTKIREITGTEGHGYGMGGGMGSHFGQKDMSLWRGTDAIDSSLQLVSCYLLRISDSQAGVSSQYADLTISYVQNGADPNVSNYVGTVGFSYDQDTYVITANGQIYEVADKSFFVDLFSFLEDEQVLPPKVA